MSQLKQLQQLLQLLNNNPSLVGSDGFTLPDGDKAPFQQMTGQRI